MRSVYRGAVPAVLALAVLVVALAGCATSATEPTSQAVALVGRGAVEADGLPAQVAPPARIRQQPDDPREPFSPNYGSQPATLQPPTRPAGPQPAVRLSDAEADLLIARAIAAHEMRRP